MARRQSRSGTTTPGPQSRCMIGKVMCPGEGVMIASQSDPELRALRSICPDLSERATSSKPSGSTGRVRRPGARASSASAMPDVSPPPPQQTSTSAASTPSSAACSAISSPTVPCPAIT